MVKGRRCHGLTVTRQARIHSANASVGSTMMETRTSFNARQHGKKQMIPAQTLHCSTQTLYGFTQICGTTIHTNILCGFLGDFCK
jgi:hypothetical protein